MPDLNLMQWAVLLAAVFAVAFFYSSVGHGGATGYLAALAVLGIAPISAKVAVLVANVLVAGVAWWRFWRAGHFDGKVLWLFAAASVPAAWLGSTVKISPQAYKLILGGVLTVAGLTLLFRSRWQTEDVVVRQCLWPAALAVGAVLGLLAGLTGIGGGVFLSPLLYLFRWVKPKTTGGIAAGFIVLNSIAGLAGAGWEKITHAGLLLWLTVPAVAGALIGTRLGAQRWSSVTFSRVLAGVRVPLAEAAGRVLREAVRAPEDSPDRDRSTRDGFAVLQNDRSETFSVVDTLHAADWKPRPLKPGEAVRVATGAALPCENLRVVMQENVGRAGDRIKILRQESAANVRRRGEELRAGDTVLSAGKKLDAGALAVLASVGCARPLASPRLRVLHFTTGDEIVPPEQSPKPGQIRDSNSVLIRALLEKSGGEVTHRHLPENFAESQRVISTFNHRRST